MIKSTFTLPALSSLDSDFLPPPYTLPDLLEWVGLVSLLCLEVYIVIHIWMDQVKDSDEFFGKFCTARLIEAVFHFHSKLVRKEGQVVVQFP